MTLSLTSRERNGKMSSKRKKGVSEIIADFRSKYPGLGRPLMRKLIRLQHPEINLRTLDRHLKKSFTLELSTPLERKEPPAGKEFSEQYYQYIKELKEIGRVSVVSPDTGISMLTYFILCLPKPLKDIVNSRVLPIMRSSVNDSTALKMAIDEVSTLLYETLIQKH